MPPPNLKSDFEKQTESLVDALSDTVSGKRPQVAAAAR